MNLKPGKGFAWLAGLADFFNPYIIIASIAGLILEYTVYKTYVLGINRIIDFLFVIDFMIRLISFPAKKYFFRNYGWVDMLACIPALSAFMHYGQYFGLFKVMRIGRFFKIIRILRFLRIFSFLKKMKGDSLYIQERIMKIGVAIVIVFVFGIALVDIVLTENLMQNSSDYYKKIYELSRKKVDITAERDSRIIYYTDNLKLYTPDGTEISGVNDYLSKRNAADRWYIEVNFSNQVVESGGALFPVKGILADGYDIMVQHDRIMLILVSSLIGIILLLIFYAGYIFAKDMKIVQLVNDSFDAGDYWLLREEARHAARESEEDLDELMTLLLRSSAVSEKLETSDSMYSFSYMEDEENRDAPEVLSGSDIDKVTAMLDRIERKIDEMPAKQEAEIMAIAGETASKAVKT